MNKTRLAMIVLVVLMTLSFLVLAYVVKRPGNNSGASIPEPISYAKPTPGGQFLFVAHGRPEAEEKLSGSSKTDAATVRQKYPKPGIYRNEQPAVFLYEITGYAPDENVYMTQDGRSIIRLEGEWWTEKAYPAGKRLELSRENELLDSPALSFYRDGVKLKTWLLRELIRSPDDLPHTPKFILWPAGASLNEEKKEFYLYTQDSRRIVIQTETGELTVNEPTGLGNRFAQVVLVVTLALMLIVLLSWARYAFRRRPQRIGD